jgi:cytochrome P450 family 9
MYLWIFLLLLAIFAIYKYAKRNENYFIERGVSFVKPVFYIGSSAPVLFGRYSLPDFHKKIHLDFWPAKIVGIFGLGLPHYFVSSPDIVKQICVKDFESFSGHTSVLQDDELLSRLLTMLKGEKWKNMRSILSPAFTGSKMRTMHELIKNCTCNSIRTLNGRIKDKEDFEMKEFFSNFTIDVIATCAFGLEVDSFENPENEFKEIAMLFLYPKIGVKEILQGIFYYYFPKVYKWMGLKIMDERITKFFRSTILDTMKYREENNIVRPDMIHLLMEAKKGNLKHSDGEMEADESLQVPHNIILTDDDVIAQCLIFFTAGFEVVSSAFAFAAYELAVNPSIQDKLRSEIMEREKSSDQNFSYEEMQKMKYMDHFITEVLRKWPPVVATERICNKNCVLEIENRKLLEIEKDKTMMIPTYAFHHNPEFFPNPDKFDPDRFDDENKEMQNMNAFMPFGIGGF